MNQTCVLRIGFFRQLGYGTEKYLRNCPKDCGFGFNDKLKGENHYLKNLPSNGDPWRYFHTRTVVLNVGKDQSGAFFFFLLVIHVNYQKAYLNSFYG